MKAIGLIASSNGLGHLRRIINLAIGFQDLGYRTEILAQSIQISRIQSELKSLNRSLNFTPIEIYGIEGPAWFKSGCNLSQPPKKIIDKIDKLDFIVSDNSLWALRYCKKVYLFGHFNWIDYWTLGGFSNFSPTVKKVFEEELNLFEKIRISFQFDIFSLNSNRLSNVNVKKINLMRYDSDFHMPISTNRQPIIWKAVGTTGLNSNRDFKFLEKSKLKIIEKETYKLTFSKYKPTLVIGRPGLGTIRDCLAAGVPFFPIWDKADVELNSNVNHLHMLGLLPFKDAECSTYNFEDAINLAYAGQLDKFWTEIWLKISESTYTICEQMVALINKN